MYLMKKIRLKFGGSFWEKLSVALLIVLVSLVFTNKFSSFPIVRAQGLGTSSGSGEQLFCARDFSNFITNGLDFDGEGFVDYWRDILVIYNTNYCQFTDIDSMLKRIDGARKQLRQAFYVCDNKTVERVTAQYYQLSAELYYLRHFVDTKASPDPKATDVEKAEKVQKSPSVHDKFINMFVNKLKYFDSKKAEQIYVQIQQKYETKIDEYRNCTDPNFGALVQKVKDLSHTVETVQQMFKKFYETNSARIKAAKKKIADNPGLLSAFSADSMGDFMSRVTSTRINGESPSESTIWEQISNTAKENAPFYYGTTKAYPPTVTFDTILDDLNTIRAREEQNDLDIRYVSAYDVKYRQVSGSGLDKLKDNLNSLITTIDETFSPIDQVKVCATYIVDKQCGG